jgi:hypothetical protein
MRAKLHAILKVDIANAGAPTFNGLHHACAEWLAIALLIALCDCDLGKKGDRARPVRKVKKGSPGKGALIAGATWV